MRQTTMLKAKDIEKKWFLIDASGVVLGKLATFVATYLRGKNKSTFTPHLDMGDNVVIINAEKVVLTSNKEQKKMYYSHSGFPGGLKTISAFDLRKKKPTALVEKAIKGMLPHNKLGAKQFKNLYVYAGEEHKQQSQNPVKIEVN